jgi:hypothetical protein
MKIKRKSKIFWKVQEMHDLNNLSFQIVLSAILKFDKFDSLREVVENIAIS